MAIEIITRRVESEKKKIGADDYDIQISLNSDNRIVIRYIPRNPDRMEELIVLGTTETSELVKFIGKLDRLHERLDRYA